MINLAAIIPISVILDIIFQSNVFLVSIDLFRFHLRVGKCFEEVAQGEIIVG